MTISRADVSGNGDAFFFFLHMGETKHVSATWCWPIWADENEENEEDEDDENRVPPLEESCGSDESFFRF